MHMYQEALLSYQTARDFAHKYLTDDEKSIYTNLSAIYDKAKIEI